MLIQRDDDDLLSIPESYRSLILKYRRSQLKATEANIKRIESVFDAAIKYIPQRIAEADAVVLASGYYDDILRDISGRLALLRTDYANLLVGSMAGSAQDAADRESATASLLKMGPISGLAPDRTWSKSLSLTEGATDAKISVSFGQVAATAVERSANRVYSDGWKLSDRLYDLDAHTKEIIRNSIVQGVTEQISASKLADRLEEQLSAPGKDTPRYRAMRIARTEINTAHREAHILSAQDANGQLHPWILAIGWRLSVSHPHLDICDVWADDDDGLGPGNYLPADVPSDHPHGLCYTVSVLVDYPDVAAPSKEADADGVDETQVRYYAEKYEDPTAVRWLAKRGAA